MPKLLVVDDEQDNIDLLRRRLVRRGFSVLSATSALEAIALARADRPDLILMDINMPNLDGLKATSYIRQNDLLRHVPVVALTANVMKGDREKALDAGCDGYIQKPIDIDRFPGEVLRFIKQNGHSG